VETYLSVKLLAPVVGVLLATLTGTESPIFYSLILGAAAFFAPDVLLFYAIGKRKARLNSSLPDATDLLVICMEAGLGMDQAVLRVAEELQSVCPELSEELLTISREQRAGKPRVDAWRSMASRVDLDAVRQFVAMLVQAEKLGTPVARALGQFADSLRTKRLLTAEENAAKTSVKLVFPLVFFIFPAIFVVLLGPAAITLMQSFDQTAR
jgi:tight adherence protein C